MYPVGLNLAGKRCVVIGGGNVAERKIRGLLSCECHILVVSPLATDFLRELAGKELIEWRRKHYETGDLNGAFLVFAATDNAGVQDAVVHDARAAGRLINVADAPGNCDFHVPATVRRGDLHLTVSTSGRSPAVSAMVRRQLEKIFVPEYAQFIELMARVRQGILKESGTSEETKALFQQILHDDMLDWLQARQWGRIKAHLESALGRPVDFDFESLLEERQ